MSEDTGTQSKNDSETTLSDTHDNDNVVNEGNDGE